MGRKSNREGIYMVARRANHLPAMQETWVQSLGGEDPLEKEMATTPYSCLETPTSGEAWWATVHGVAKSQTRVSDFTFTFHFIHIWIAVCYIQKRTTQHCQIATLQEKFLRKTPKGVEEPNTHISEPM